MHMHHLYMYMYMYVTTSHYQFCTLVHVYVHIHVCNTLMYVTIVVPDLCSCELPEPAGREAAS